MSYSVHYIIPEERLVGGEIKHLHWEVSQKKKSLHFILNSSMTGMNMYLWIFWLLCVFLASIP